MFGIAEGCEGVQDRTLKAVDTAWETELVPCEVVTQQHKASRGMKVGWEEMVWWIRNGESLFKHLSTDEELFWHCQQLLHQGKAAGDRSVVDKIKEAIRLQSVMSSLRPDEFEVIDILTALKGL